MTIHYFVSADEPNDKDLKAIFNNLELIFQYKDFILNDSKYSNIHIKGFGVYPLYVPTFPLFIGDMLLLWAETCWKQDDKYFYSITGSPLSGSNSSRYWSKTEGFGYESTNTFTKQLTSANCLLRTGSPVKTTDSIPVNVPKRTASDLSIYDLIEVLKAF